MRLGLLFSMVIGGLLVMAVCGWYLRADWQALQRSQARFELTVSGDTELREVFVAYAAQDIHRTNVFAEGVGLLLGALLAAVGAHGLCLLPRGDRRRQRGSGT